jgi:hypothetical protein
MLDHFKGSMQFLRALGFAIGHVYSFLTEEQRNNIMTNKSPQFAYGLGHGLGHSFSSLKPEIQEQLLKNVEQSNDFGRGLGKGVARAFKDLNDEILQNEILIQGVYANPNSAFAYSLGMGLGIDFPSLSDEIHQATLKLVENEPVTTAFEQPAKVLVISFLTPTKGFGIGTYKSSVIANVILVPCSRAITISKSR